MRFGHPEPELLEHLKVEFGDYGRRAVEFLLTARSLLEAGQDGRPRLAESVAYCLREAMQAIPDSQPVDNGETWKRTSRKVVSAKRSYERARGVPGQDEEGALESLLSSIDDLERVHGQEGIHQRRLIAVVVSRTGAAPVAKGTEPIRAYQDLLERLNGGVHGSISIEEARDLWSECLGILRQLFLPPDLRHGALEALAEIDSPSADDVPRLLELVVGPHHLRRFLARVTNPEWLDLLAGTGILDPTSGQDSWPASAAVVRLAKEHPDAVSAWLERMYERGGSDPVAAWFIGRAALDIGTAALPLVLRIVQDHPGATGSAMLGVIAAEKTDPSGELLDSLADELLNEASWHAARPVEPLLEKLVEGVSRENAERRLRLLCFKIRSTSESDPARRLFEYEPAGSISDPNDDFSHHRFTVLLGVLIDVARRVRQWMSTPSMLELVDTLPAPISSRIRVWLLADAQDVTPDALIGEVAAAVRQRDPTGDDLRLLDRVHAECEPSQYIDIWQEALGPAPGVEELGQTLARGELKKDWRRAFLWIALLPDEVVGAWERPFAILSAAYRPPSRDSLEKRAVVEVIHGQSPISAEELRAVAPEEAARMVAAWRPNPTERLVSARALARTLEDVVKDDPAGWLGSPMQIATRLRHPTYIQHYLRGAAKVCQSGASPVDELLDLVVLVRTHPWEAISLGKDEFEFDTDWRGAEHASVDLIKALADSDVGFGDRSDDVWGILQAAVSNREEQSGIVSGARDPLETAINRPCTRALDTALSVMAYEFRSSGHIRSDALDLLDATLRLDGVDGAEHRAILATRLGFLGHVAPDWLEDHRPLLLGNDAPDGLAQLTIDQAVKWSRPNPWLLENFRERVRDSASRGVENSLDHLLIAMLWRTPGYSVQENVRFLQQSPQLLSNAGEALGRLLRNKQADGDHIELATEFWRTAIQAGKSDGLPGFGWFTEIVSLDEEVWADLTLATLRGSGGRIDWSHKVAERAAASPPSRITLDIMNELVRRSGDEWDRRSNAETATVLLAAATELEGTAEYARLRTTLLERGAL